MTLPPQIGDVVQPLFNAMPLEKAMGQLVVRQRADQLVLKIAHDIMSKGVISARPDLAAGIWLYVDELEPSHKLSQSMVSQTGSFWHAIMHRREGDFANSLYWYRNAGHHPVMERITDFSAERLIQSVRENEPAAVSLQRTEWATLFQWCAFQQVS
ncbi:MAG: hypothetical protein JSS66_16280 [Armatimonadetes bacterium]|nr:hypothetical protein [Armatimonadota bacterium]